MAGKVFINGIDVQDKYHLYVSEINDFSPLQSVNHNFHTVPGSARPLFHTQEMTPRTLTLSGQIDGYSSTVNSNAVLRIRVEDIAHLIGWRGTGYREIGLEIRKSGSQTQDVDVPAFFRVVVESFSVQLLPPIDVSLLANFTISFRVIEAINIDGRTVRDFTLTSTIWNVLYFRDEDAKQGASGVITEIEHSGNSGLYTQTVQLYALAAFPEWTDRFGSPSGSAGTHPVVEGAFGNPAVNFTNSGQWVSYHTVPNYAPHFTEGQFSIMIRFKRNYNIGDGTIKYLFEEPDGYLRIYINSNASSDIVVESPILPSTITLNGSGVSNTDWNVLSVVFGSPFHVYSGLNAQARLEPAGVSSLKGTLTGTMSLPSGSFWIGSRGGTNQGTLPAKCHIAEVAIWKHGFAFADNPASVCYEANRPVPQILKYDLNTRLSFYLNFSKGFVARSNRHGFLQRSTVDTLDNMRLFWDTDRRTARITALANFVLTEDIANLVSLTDYGMLFPQVERFNKFVITAARFDPDVLKARVSYMPLRTM